jgi:hypothetical protein
MNKLRLCVCPVHRKCIDYEGEWDGTYDDSFEYIIYDSEGIEVAGRGGYNTAEQAREAGEKKLKEMEERYGIQ